MPVDFEPITDSSPASGINFEPIEDAPKGNIDFEPVETPVQSTTPATDAAVAYGQRMGLDLSPEQIQTGNRFVSGAVKGLGELVPRSIGAAARMIGESATPVVGGIEEIYQTGKDIGKVAGGAPVEKTFQEKPFNQYTAEDWGRFVAQRGVDAAMAIPLFRGLRPEIRANIIQGGEVTDASKITSATGATQPEVRLQVDEETPLRQQGETPEAQPQEEIAQPTTEGGESDANQRSQESDQGQRGETAQGQEEILAPETTAEVQPPAVGANVKGFEQIYGEGEIPAGDVLSPEEEFQAAQDRANTGKADPYGIVDRARTGQITPDEMGDLIYEHGRLVNEAAAAEGTPQYEELYNRARTFASNVVKPAETAWARQGRTMQIEAPIDYSKLTGFRAALEKRMGREMLPEEAPAFNKIAGEVAEAKKARNGAASQAMGRAVNHLKGVKDISFEDAVKQIHEEFDKAMNPCK